MSSDIHRTLNDFLLEMHRENENSLDVHIRGYIESVFGSLENFELVKDDYVLEMEPTTLQHPNVINDFSDDYYKVVLETKYRIRRKTEDEKRAERVEKILHDHVTKLPMCIVCRLTIMSDAVATPHGNYHPRPYDCLDGR